MDLNKNDDDDERGVAVGGVEDIVTEIVYNKVGSVIQTIDPRGYVTENEYDEIQRLTSTTVGLLATSVYDEVNKVQTATTPETSTTTFTYDLNKGTGSTVFDAAGWKPTHVASPGPESFGGADRHTETTYDELYRPILVLAEYEPGFFAETETGYDEVGNVLTVTDPLDKVTTTRYDALNRPELVTNPDTTEVETEYTSTGLVWKVHDELDRYTETEYDSAGRPVKVYAPLVADENGIDVRPTTQTAYDAAGNAALITDPLGNVTETIHDELGRPLHVIAPAVYDASTGQTFQPIVSTEYDEVGNPVKSIDPYGNETETRYDWAGRPDLVTGSPVAVHGQTDLVRPTTASVYDQNGNVVQVIDARDNVTDNGYDSLNRLISTKTYPQPGQTIEVKFQFDDAGNQHKVTDGNGYTTVFDYDGLGRNLSITHPDGESKTSEYDAMNLVARVDENGRRTEYIYDNRHRLKKTTYIDEVAPGQDHTRDYTYDDVGNILSVNESSDDRADVAYTYDDLNRVATETSNGVTHTYTYDVVGNLREVTHGNNGLTIASTYDAHNRLDTMTEGGRTTTYLYEARGLVAAKVLPNNQVVVHTFDAAGRKLSTTAYTDTNQTDTVYDYLYGYDKIGNVVDTQENVTGEDLRTVAMVYDDVYRLEVETIVDGTSTTETSYTYDLNNNRTAKSVVVDGGPAQLTTYTLDSLGLNQLVQMQRPDGSTVSYAYDEAGNRTSRTDADGTDVYGYDYENRLLDLHDDVAGGATNSYHYAYDYRTRRVVRDETNAASGDETLLVFSGGLSVQEYDFSSTTSTPVGSSPTVEYVRGSDWGGGIGGVLYTLRNSQPSYNHYNNRGDVVAKTDDAGSLTYQAGYEAYGTRTREVGSTADRQKANTKDEDPTGLLNEGMRYRDLEAGVWLTRDPAGFVDGPNLYAYVRQNPWSYFDPYGLESNPSQRLQMTEEESLCQKRSRRT